MSAFWKKIPRNILLLGIVSLLTDLSSEMIMPLLPMFIVSLGGAAISIGFIGGFTDALASILKIFSGYFGDRLAKRKEFVFAGYGISSLTKLFYVFSFSWWHVLVLRSLDRFGKGLREAPRDAIIAASSDEKSRGKLFGFHRMLDTSGAILGSIFALLLFWFFGFDFRAIFLIAAIIAFVALVPILFVKEKTAVHKTTKSLKATLKGLPKNFKLFIVVATIFALGNFTYMLFILRAQQSFQFDEKLSIVCVLLLYIWFNIIYAGLSMPVGKLSDKIGKRKVLLFGYLLFAITAFGFAFFTNLVILIVLFAFYGLFHAMVDAVQRAYVSDLVDENSRGTALGIYHTTVGVAALPAGIISGALWQIFSPQLAFIYAAGMAAIAVALLVFLKFEKK